MSDDDDSMEGNIENDKMIIEDIEYFYRFSQLYAISNYILTMDHFHENIQLEEKEKLLDEFIENNLEWLDNYKFLDQNIPLADVKEILAPCIKHDIVQDLHFIDVKDLNTSIHKITMKIVYTVINELVDEGLMKMAWSSKENDFVFIPVIDEDKKPKKTRKKKK